MTWNRVNRQPARRRRLAPWAAAAALLLLLACWGGTAAAKGMSIKVGINRASLSGLTYTHDDGTTEYSNNDSLVGNEIFVEWVLSEHFSLEIDSAVSPLTRTYTLGPDASPVSDNVTETYSYVTYGANLYFTKAERKGFHVLMGIATGTASVEHDFEGGTLGTESTANDVGLAVFKLGMDWVTNFAGLRFQYQLVEGQASNTTQITGVKQTVDLNGGMMQLGVFAYF